MKFPVMQERKLWWIALFAMATAIAPIIWFGILEHPKYRLVTVNWLINSIESDAVSGVDGKRVAVSGEVLIGFPEAGKPIGYRLINPSTSTSFRDYWHWIDVMPAPGDKMPEDRDGICVGGTLHISRSPSGQIIDATISADPMGPNMDYWWNKYISMAVIALPGMFVAVGVVVILRPLTRLRQPLPGRCPACGYDIRATSMRCPECGKI